MSLRALRSRLGAAALVLEGKEGEEAAAISTMQKDAVLEEIGRISGALTAGDTADLGSMITRGNFRPEDSRAILLALQGKTRPRAEQLRQASTRRDGQDFS